MLVNANADLDFRDPAVHASKVSTWLSKPGGGTGGPLGHAVAVAPSAAFQQQQAQLQVSPEMPKTQTISISSALQRTLSQKGGAEDRKSLTYIPKLPPGSSSNADQRQSAPPSLLATKMFKSTRLQQPQQQQPPQPQGNLLSPENRMVSMPASQTRNYDFSSYPIPSEEPAPPRSSWNRAATPLASAVRTSSGPVTPTTTALRYTPSVATSIPNGLHGDGSSDQRRLDRPGSLARNATEPGGVQRESVVRPSLGGGSLVARPITGKGSSRMSPAGLSQPLPSLRTTPPVFNRTSSLKGTKLSDVPIAGLQTTPTPL